jgi:hypothetical protein
MKSIFKLIGIMFITLVLLQACGEDNEKEVKTKSNDEIRLEKADSSQKACIKTLGQGVYKDKSLSWKLDSCNVPK